MDEALQAAIRQYQAGQFEEAAQKLQALLKIQPYNSQAVHYFGLAAHGAGQHADAIGLLRQATSISPGSPEYHTSLGNVLYDVGQTQAAFEEWNKALEFKPDDGPANLRLANLYRVMGDVPRALACLRRALESNPDQPKVHSELLHLLYHDPESDDFTIYGEHLEYFRQHAAPLAGLIHPHLHEYDADRPIRIGYLCPDFRAPAIACFIAPILKSHRNAQYQIALYSDVPLNSHSQPHASPHLSRNIASLDDQQVADLIRRDQIDILVDLAVHSAGNRMLVLAQNPAPIAATYLPYPGSTGLATVFYRITDVLLDPHGAHIDFRIENLVRLPNGYVCYLPPSDTVVAPLPPRPIRFGCSCQLAQINGEVLRVWSQILNQVPDSQLCLEAPGLGDAFIATTVRQRYAAAGIPSARLELQPYVDGTTSAGRLGQLHIALDPFPFNTMATACDALWMGVPVIALAGKEAPGRFGLSLLTHLALPEYVASNVEAYIQGAIALANDVERLTALRATLRQAMLDAKLTDGMNFVRNLEAAYREMWRRRCALEPHKI